MATKTKHTVHEASIGLYRRIAIIFIVLTIVLLALVIVFSFAKARIVVTMVPASVTRSFPVPLKATATDAGVVRGKVVHALVSAEQQFPATGTMVKTSNAKTNTNSVSRIVGTVTLKNNSTRAQTLVATTRLLTSDDVLLRLATRVVIPARGTKAGVQVYADTPEQFAGVPEGAQMTIPGLSSALQALIFAVSDGIATPQALSDVLMTTPQGDLVTVISADDIAQAQIALKAMLINTAKDHVAGDIGDLSVSPDRVLLKDLTQSTDIVAGTAVNNFIMKMTADVIIAAVDEASLKRVAAQSIAQAIGDDHELSGIPSDGVLATLKDYDLPTQTATLDVEVRAAVIPSLHHGVRDTARLVGLTTVAAEAYLKQTPGVQNVEFHLSPFWLSALPNEPESITVELNTAH